MTPEGPGVREGNRNVSLPSHGGYAPVWMKRPAGARFGFGNKLIRFAKDTTQLSLYHVPENPGLKKTVQEFD